MLLEPRLKCFFVDSDADALAIAGQNKLFLEGLHSHLKAVFLKMDVQDFSENVDVVVQNPPFGTKQEHADKKFLEKAFSLAQIIYTMHKYSTKGFVETISKDFGFKITHLWRFEFPIKELYVFHTKPVRNIDVGLWRMEKV